MLKPLSNLQQLSLQVIGPSCQWTRKEPFASVLKYNFRNENSRNRKCFVNVDSLAEALRQYNS